MEQRIEIGDEHTGQQYRQSHRHHDAHRQGKAQQAHAQVVDLLLPGPLADALAHNDGSGPG